jgi:hypothetical protein
MEHLATTAEANFLSQLPAGDDLARSALRKLESPWWSDAHLIARRAQQLRAHGWPVWAVRIYTKLFS